MKCEIDKKTMRCLTINWTGSILGILCFVLELIFEYKGLIDWKNWAHITMYIGFLSGGIAITTALMRIKFLNLKEAFKELKRKK